MTSPVLSWIVGVTPPPAWVKQTKTFWVELDDWGNGYFQIGDTAVLVPKGGVVEWDWNNHTWHIDGVEFLNV